MIFHSEGLARFIMIGKDDAIAFAVALCDGLVFDGFRITASVI
jgi:hypothetical protein